jgi:hypothetical protein
MLSMKSDKVLNLEQRDSDPFQYTIAALACKTEEENRTFRSE